MFNMLGRLMWVAVGALGVKAWEAAEQERSKGAKPRSRSRKKS